MVDLPTLGRPTIPILRVLLALPNNTFFSSGAFFFPGILNLIKDLTNYTFLINKTRSKKINGKSKKQPGG